MTKSGLKLRYKSLDFETALDFKRVSGGLLLQDKDLASLDLNNLKIVTNKKSLLYLIGTELDYSDGLNGKGFEWINPNASRTCGCGESFSL